MQINSLPILRNDETLYSIAARTRLQNVARDDREACRSLFGPSSNIRIAEFPVNLSRFCEITGGHFGGPQEVLLETTLSGFFERIGGPPWRAAKWRRPIETAGYGLATLSNGSVKIWHGCPCCVESDLLTYGTSYWRRSHQIPAAFFCLVHSTPLKLSIAPHNDRHIRFLLPEQTDLSTDYRSIDLVPYEDVLFRLTKLTKDALFDRSDMSEFVSSHATILRALAIRGLLTGGGKIRVEEFAAELSRRYGFLQHNVDFRNLFSSKSISILGHSFGRSDSWRRPQHNLLLIDWLFGSWNSYRQQCAWQALMDLPVQVGATMALPPYIDDQLKHRSICLDFINNHNGPLRSNFSAVARASFRWLLDNDIKWFDLNFPDRRCTAVQGELF